MSKPPAKPTSPDRRARLAEELRRNLKRRKAQDRARSAASDPDLASPADASSPPAPDHSRPRND